MNNYKTLKIEIIEDKIAHIIINRPDKANAMNQDFWQEIKHCINWVDENPQIRVVIITGAGKYFSAGIDLEFLTTITALTNDECEGRKREQLKQNILQLQSSISAFEKCRKPIIAAVNGGCIGSGVDLISSCDMRYSTNDAYFSIKEIDMAITADVGTLQRLSHIINDGILRELAYTGRKVSGLEAKQIGLVNNIFSTQEELLREVINIAKIIAHKSPLAIRGTKDVINYSRNHTIEDSLLYVATLNAGILLSNDLKEALEANLEKRQPAFKD